jgi:(p)ppGpp synthase/HD superfamily hydrolase
MNQHAKKGGDWMAEIKEQLQQSLAAKGIVGKVSGRLKQFNSLLRKMQRKGVGIDDIYDVQGLRIVVATESQCYAALRVVHGLWQPITDQFDDYIANPKRNSYRGLHTAVVGPSGTPIEVQIRTTAMHRIAEDGIAAHSRYKAESRYGS